MCVTAWIKGMERELRTVRELRAALPVVVIEQEAEIRARLAEQGFDLEDSCLCAVDLDATASANGMVWLRGPMDGEFVECDTTKGDDT